MILGNSGKHCVHFHNGRLDVWGSDERRLLHNCHPAELCPRGGWPGCVRGHHFLKMNTCDVMYVYSVYFHQAIIQATNYVLIAMSRIWNRVSEKGHINRLPVAGVACLLVGDWQRHCDGWAVDLGRRESSVGGCSWGRRGRVIHAEAISVTELFWATG